MQTFYPFLTQRQIRFSLAVHLVSSDFFQQADQWFRVSSLSLVSILIPDSSLKVDTVVSLGLEHRSYRYYSEFCLYELGFKGVSVIANILCVRYNRIFLY